MNKRKPQTDLHRVGRPPLPDGAVKSVFAVRLSESEQDELREAAKNAGMKVIQWAREVLLEHARTAR